MRLFVSLLILSGGYAASAQEVRPDFAWQGKVDGIAILRLHASQLDVKIQEGAPVADQQYKFAHPLPPSRQDARLRVLEGRGFVHILEQPRIDNQYTLTVFVEDRQPGSSFYSIALFWDSSTHLFEPEQRQERTDSMVWSGRVDEEAIVSCHEKICTSRSEHGAPVAAEHFKFSRPLPDEPVDVTLTGQQGRGEIRLVEQPSERNHYTARVSIRDPQNKSSEYSFKLQWTRPNGKEPASLAATGTGLLWSGIVSGRVRVTVRGGAAFSQALDGGRVENAQAQVLVPLPARSDLEPTIKIGQGRGRAEIIERPSAQNSYQFVFEIADPGPGSGSYSVEVDW